MDCELGLINYNVFRYDRCSETSICLWGGGVLIGIRKDITSRLLITSVLNVKQNFVSFSIGNSYFVVGGVYIPPLSLTEVYESHLTSVEFLFNKYTNHTFIICGDYNLPEIVWNNDDCGLLYSYSSSTRAPCIPELFTTY